MNRREVLNAAAAGSGGVLFAPVLRAMDAALSEPGAQHSSNSGEQVDLLDASDMSLVSELSEIIIPETDTPGAREAGVPSFIVYALANFFDGEERGRYLLGLRKLNDLARTRYGGPFIGCSDKERFSLVEEVDRRAFSGPSDDDLTFFYRIHKQLTITGYYTSQIGQTVELHIAPFGGFEADLPLVDVGRSWS